MDPGPVIADYIRRLRWIIGILAVIVIVLGSLILAGVL